MLWLPRWRPGLWSYVFKPPVALCVIPLVHCCPARRAVSGGVSVIPKPAPCSFGLKEAQVQIKACKIKGEWDLWSYTTGSAVPGCVHESLSGNPSGQMSARYCCTQAANSSRKGEGKGAASFPRGGRQVSVPVGARPWGRPQGRHLQAAGPISLCPPARDGGGLLEQLPSSTWAPAALGCGGALHRAVRGTPAGPCSQQLGKHSNGFCWCQRLAFLSTEIISGDLGLAAPLQLLGCDLHAEHKQTDSFYSCCLPWEFLEAGICYGLCSGFATSMILFF